VERIWGLLLIDYWKCSYDICIRLDDTLLCADIILLAVCSDNSILAQSSS